MPIELAFWQLLEISLFGPDRRADPSLSLISVINVFESNLDFFFPAGALPPLLQQ